MPLGSRRLRLTELLGLSVFLAGCAGRSARPLITPASAPLAGGSYIDLQAGWRVPVITPFFKSGSHLLNPDGGQTQTSRSGNALSISMRAGPDFLGYERSFYAVEGRSRDGVRIRFSAAEMIKEGKSSPQERPAVTLFRLPRTARYVRLLYLVRASNSDHNMAVVAASQLADLQAATREVQADPAHGCQPRRHSVCQWIPAGIAVRPELRRPGANAGWTPAR